MKQYIDPRPFLERPIPNILSKPLYKLWTEFEQKYINNIKVLFKSTRNINRDYILHFDTIRTYFNSYVHRSHDKQILLNDFIKSVNSVPVDIRVMPEMKNEFYLRIKELYINLLKSTDTREKENLQEIVNVEKDKYVETSIEMINLLFCKMIQVFYI